MATREQLYARYKAYDALVTTLDSALSEPLYTLRTQAYCDWLLSDPDHDYQEFIRVTVGPQFARLPLLCAVNPSPYNDPARVHPLAMTQPGWSSWGVADEAALKARRERQYDEAKARVEARKQA